MYSTNFGTASINNWAYLHVKHINNRKDSQPMINKILALSKGQVN